MSNLPQNSHNDMPASTVQRGSLLAKVKQISSEELQGWHPRLHLADLLMSFLPLASCNSARASVLRTIGFRIGEGTIIRGRPAINGCSDLFTRLTIGRDCLIDTRCTLDLEEHIYIGDRVTIGHQVMILTSSHELGPKERRAGALIRAPVTIGDGAWIGSRSIILPGVSIGAGAVVAAGSLVNKDVPPNTSVAGTPARVVESLNDSAAV